MCSACHFFCLFQEKQFVSHQTNIKRLYFDFLFDTDNKQSDPTHRRPVPLEASPVLKMIFIIGVKSYMRVTNVTLDNR